MKAAREDETQLQPARVRELHESGAAQLIDVRRPEEVEAGRIPGSVHIEMDQVGARSEEIASDRPVIFYCRVGARSSLVTQAFRNAGYDAYNMTGGLVAWAGEDLPLEPAGGTVADD